MKYKCALIVVNDIKISKEFYEGILGQKVKFDFGENIEFEGGFAIHLKEHYKGLLEANESHILTKSNNFELYFEEDDMEQLLQRLKEYKIEFLHEITEQPWGQRVMRFYDPDFHIIEVGETLESVVLRYHRATDMSIEQISRKTSMPIDFVKKAIEK